ncbi:MAG: hypothetical protein SFV55_10500 [Haliscomenobacter sp.]|uniref:hypothetical protein n=1 Tax=Haliscomenobacter sp. TaxID=2717303 RepID=UPI0029AB2AF4|nr:hypothetical protein [Haliscomenobacter sp.]MDX2068847.1 hypothetical protein [Haliscomenobacter sp.]
MKHSEISKLYSDIKDALMQGKTDSALEKLEKFISLLSDDELENQIVSLSSRYHRFKREKIQGIISEEHRSEFNAIDANIMYLLRQVKQTAIEEASMSVGEQLSELAKEGENAIEELKKITFIMAESRLLEVRIFRSYFGHLFKEKDVENFDRNINELKKVLGKEDEEENIESMSLNQADLMAKMQQIRQNMSPSDIMNLMNRMLGK